MRTTRLLAAALLAALPAACGDDGDDVTSAPTGGTDGDEAPAVTGSPGGGEDRLFIEITEGGGFVPAGHDFRTPPRAVVYDDGTVFAPGAITLQYPGPPVLPIFQGEVDDETLQQLLAEAAEAGLLGEAPDVGEQADLPIADAATTTVTVVVDGERHVVDAYALGLAGDDVGPGTGLTEAQQEARARLADFVAAVDEAVLAADEPYDPERYRILGLPAGDPGAQDPGLPAPNEIPWPAGVPEPVEMACVAVTGDAVAAFEAALADATEITRWLVGDQAFNLAVRPLLPHEPDCPPGG